MAISFTHTLQEALQSINHQSSSHQNHKTHEFEVHNNKIHKINPQCPNFLSRYSEALHQVTSLTNTHFKQLPHTSQIIIDMPFNLHNWINHNESDELAYFLSETGNNCLNHAPSNAPHKFTLHLGTKGFVISISHQGQGFNAEHINKNKLYKNEGAAVDFYRNCQNTIFFNNPQNTTEIFMLHLF